MPALKDELDRALRLDRSDSVDVLRDNVASVQHATGPTLAVTRVLRPSPSGWKHAFLISNKESCS